MSLSIVTFAQNIFTFFLNGVIGILVVFFNAIFASFGNTIMQLFSLLGVDSEAYGIFSVVLLAALLGIIGAVLYIILEITDTWEDLL